MAKDISNGQSGDYRCAGVLDADVLEQEGFGGLLVQGSGEKEALELIAVERA